VLALHRISGNGKTWLARQLHHELRERPPHARVPHAFIDLDGATDLADQRLADFAERWSHADAAVRAFSGALSLAKRLEEVGRPTPGVAWMPEGLHRRLAAVGG
jgi:hypothetical protein